MINFRKLTGGLLCVWPVLACAADQPAAKGYAVAPPPAWVIPAPPAPTPTDKLPETSSIEYLLVDRQIRVRGHEEAAYGHYVRRLLAQSAVEDAGTISIAFDSAHGSLTLHSVHVVRGEERIDQLKRARISLLQRESRLEDGIIDGTQTLTMLLEDLRVGDIIDYSYTVTYADPLDERYHASFQTHWGEPVRWSRLRILHPPERNLVVRAEAEDPAMQAADHATEVRNVGPWRELLWQWKDLPRVPSESDQPSWYRTYARLTFSEFHDWPSVVAWAVPLYEREHERSPELNALIERLRQIPDDGQRIVEALRFVQDEVRYTGLEIGAGAWRPAAPAAVLARRYGDCKDKALLMSVILQELGIDARPALVSTIWRHELRNQLPRPSAFDHVIVRVRHGGKTYWFDATRTNQGGATLDRIAQSNLGAALVVARDTRDLEDIPVPPPGAGLVEARETFDFSKGLDEPGTLEVTTVYQGREADFMRARVQQQTAEERTRSYLNYYRGRYNTIEVKEPVQIRDDRDSNQLVVSESYTVGKPFSIQEDGSRELELTSYLMTEYATLPDTRVRRTPLSVDFPAHVRHHIEVRLPEPWDISRQKRQISSPAFRYRSNVGYARQRLTLSYEFEALAEYVTVEQLAEHLKRLEEVHDDAYYYLTHPGTTGLPPLSHLNLIVVFALGGGLFVAVWAFRRALRYEPPPPATPPPPGPVGLGGWMIFPLVQLILIPLLMVNSVSNFVPFLDAKEWQALGEGLSPLRGQINQLTTLFSMVLEIGLFGINAAALILLFRHAAGLPRVYIVWVWLHELDTLVLVIQHPLAQSPLPPRWILGVQVAVLLSSVLWTLYMLKSKRVRATFTRRGRSAPLQAEAPLPVAG